MGSAPSSGITIDFIRNLNVTPKRMPSATRRSQLFGRTKPISRHGVCDKWTHNKTNSALPGRKSPLPRKMSTMARRPKGPNPRRRAAKTLSGDSGVEFPRADSSSFISGTLYEPSAGRVLPTISLWKMALTLNQRIDAPFTRSLRGHVQEDETEEDGGHALVLHGPVTVRKVKLPVRDRHHAGENEGYRTSEKAEHNQDAAEEL